jgi:hypothetical protein
MTDGLDTRIRGRHILLTDVIVNSRRLHLSHLRVNSDEETTFVRQVPARV